VVAVGERRFCIAVDELLGQEEIVIKTIEGIDAEATGTVGATITGDGEIVLILDPSAMARRAYGMSKA
jgi:two-component system chemotaxis sensor kinase CheA